MRQGLRQLCEGLGGFTVVAEAENGAQAVALARTAQPDVILMDIVMPDMDGVEAIRQIVHESPVARIIALAMYRQEQYMLDAIRAGARVSAQDRGCRGADRGHRGRVPGRLPHRTHHRRPRAERVPPAHAAASATGRAADRERDGCPAPGRPGVDNQDIAQALGYSVYTVANRLRTIYEKLHVTNRTQAALYALRQGWATLDKPPA